MLSLLRWTTEPDLRKGAAHYRARASTDGYWPEVATDKTWWRLDWHAVGTPCRTHELALGVAERYVDSWLTRAPGNHEYMLDWLVAGRR